jgi:cysteine desulfurase
MDWSATTPLCDSAKKAIFEHIDDFGNPSSQYELGRKSRLLIEDARERIAKCINADPDEIYFTSSGSEANTWALSNYITAASNIEHHSIKPQHIQQLLNTKDGLIDPHQMCFVNHKYPKAFEMISCMYINNEIGTIQSIKEMAQIAHGKGMLFHCDGVQAVGHIPVDVKELGVEMLSASGHKFGAPKGVGFLYVKHGIKVNKLIQGGKQESNLRGGTENIIGILSMAAAIEDAVTHMEERNAYVKSLRDTMLSKLLQIEGSHLNGSLEQRTVSNINIRFDGILGSRLVTMCDLYGLCISSGSACNEGVPTASHVLKAIGLSDEEALSSIRITLGHTNTMEEVEQAVNIITKLVERIREESLDNTKLM